MDPAQSLVEVEATIERRPAPVFSYAAFATFNGCSALNFAGGATTAQLRFAVTSRAGRSLDTGGNVGTNGNLDGNGGPTTINGTLSTPQAGVGNCTAGNVTAATISGWGTVEEGLVTLPQQITLPTPPNITPPTSNITFNYGGLSGWRAVLHGQCRRHDDLASDAGHGRSDGQCRLRPAVPSSHLKAGIYEVNSLSWPATPRSSWIRSR